ncbi:MAG TPA: RagB/SusD family nutrient uptake outer membrane protein [Pedobacter sp.]|uniref:RagB/SusD family nutrient uptake outer membrane protein n=1 Tax=Pedobacter sp. TaxID=1411316 RepID=UPI002C487F06|nr:RagB/SusD family nutrient uptake outer membrane protein [Pedobacter sp.]HMI03500.1 RagB/SusD family nutrient uptake outer membrane protein [Pedobacter sp.]
MKKIYIAIVLLLIGATSCKKSFIELGPEDSYTDEVYYKTEQQFRSAMVAAYAPLRDVLVNDYFTSEMHSDNTIYQAIPGNRGTSIVERENISDFTNTSTNAYAAATWQHTYTGISRCNIIIERLAASDIAASAKTTIDGQAKFLRALNYFKLVRLYGGVPLFLKEVTTADEAFKPRASVEEVYNQIIADAKDAITELGQPTKFPQTGEATKGAATILLAEVYAAQKKWADAEPLLNNLLTMGYDLHGNYADAFLPANKNGKESIFEIQFLGGTVTGSTPNVLSFHFLPRSKDTKLLTGITIDNTGTGGWNTPSDDLIKDFETGDQRLDASIGIAEGTYDASNYFAYSAAKSIVNYVPAAGKTGVPYIKKYLHAPLVGTTGSGDDFPIYRFSDALLLLAEVLNEQGKSSDALTPLNRVRKRAGLGNFENTDQTLLRAAILHERRVELAFENHRWSDLLRTGNAKTVINAFGVKIRQQLPYLSSDAYVIDDHHLLFPIPQNEVGLNPKIVQNPGYF